MSIIKHAFDVELGLTREFALHDKNIVWRAFVR